LEDCGNTSLREVKKQRGEETAFLMGSQFGWRRGERILQKILGSWKKLTDGSTKVKQTGGWGGKEKKKWSWLLKATGAEEA